MQNFNLVLKKENEKKKKNRNYFQFIKLELKCKLSCDLEFWKLNFSWIQIGLNYVFENSLNSGKNSKFDLSW